MKTLDETTNGGRPGPVLTVPSSIARAEQRVREIRSELSEANRALKAATHDRNDTPTPDSYPVDAIRAAEAEVAAIEQRLKPAREELTEERKAYGPKFRAAVASDLASAGQEILDAVVILERAIASLTEIEKFAVAHGLDLTHASRCVIDAIGPLETVGESLVRKA